MPRVVAVFAHPDDESFAAGGLLARAAAGGAVVDVIAMTAGDGGRDRSRTKVDLAELRRRELRCACDALGVRELRVLDHPDGGLAALPPDALARDLSAALGPTPELVVTHGADGMYGHLDHLATRRAALAATSALGVPRVLSAELPRGLMRHVWRALRKHHKKLACRDLRQEELGVDPAAADLRLDIRGHAGAKLAALAAHRSQLPDGDVRRFIHPGLVDAVLEEELYSVAAGRRLPSGATDPLADL